MRDAKGFKTRLVVTGLGDGNGTSVHIEVEETFGHYLRRQLRRLFGRD